MIIKLGSILTVTIKHTTTRGNTIQYIRRVPLDLLDRHQSKNIKKPLGSINSDILEIERKVKALDAHYDALWANMRKDSSITPQDIRDDAIELLSQYGLKPFPSVNPQINVDVFRELVVESKRELSAAGDEEEYKSPSTEVLKPHESLAVKYLNTAPPLVLSDALAIYLRGHLKQNDAKFVTYTKRAWKELTEAIGDKPFMEVSQEDLADFIDSQLGKGKKTSTVRRLINCYKAVFNVVIDVKGITKRNPFNKPRIAGLGEDSVQRNPFSDNDLKAIGTLCEELDDDMRWILALQVDTGCRLAEVCGLALDDIYLDDDIPHLTINSHPWRGLKNKSSIRVIPLVGYSLWAAKRIKANATEDQKFAFPRYTSDTGCEATHASNALNAWLRAKGFTETTHSFRHSIRDRLRNIEAPDEAVKMIGGWTRSETHQQYGKGYVLRKTHGWLLKIATKQ